MCEILNPDFQPDELYGRLRPPSRVQEWERNFTPLSACQLTPHVGAALRGYREAASHKILSPSAQALLFIWMMDSDCQIWIAVEELSPHENQAIAGYPRFSEFTQKKLGHPSIKRGADARIAGELFLDEGEDGRLYWIFNVSSGRFCADHPPAEEQKSATLKLFRAAIDDHVRMDEEP